MALEKKPHKPHLTQQAHDLIRAHFEKWRMHPNLVIDATCGNGHDTLFLSELANQVLAFDIQKLALEKTYECLLEAKREEKVKLIHTGHENLKNYVSQEIDCVMFNLGYLPQADKSITTLVHTTLVALNASLELLTERHGLLSILCYPGHAEGRIELDAVKHWIDALPKEWTHQKYLSNYPSDKAPVLFHVTHS